MSADERRQIWEKIARIETCMMVTIDAGVLRARPMVGTIEENRGAIWFIANRLDHKDEEILRDPRMCLAYSDPSRNVYVSLSGTGRVVRDEAKQRALWTPSIDSWFDDGPQDPNAILIEFTPTAAEYWDAPHTELGSALEMLTGTNDRPDGGENKKVSMR